MKEIIKQHIIQKREPIGFDEFMHLALYHPQKGYYRAKKEIIGVHGDFITAPEISPLFGWTIAKHCQEVFKQTANNILEFGAGSGALASQILTKTPNIKNYFILELSASLKQLQQKTIKKTHPKKFKKVIWLNKLPQNFSGVVIANEVLDAIPTKRFEFSDKTYELKVNENLEWQNVISKQLPPVIITNKPYQTEINFMIKPWLKSLASSLDKAHILLIDYGYSKNEYYHSQRTTGTLRCYYKHSASDNPFVNIGKQDITSSVDFSSLVDYAQQLDLQLSGWTTQAHFLINCGIEEFIQDFEDEFERVKHIQQLKQLILPNAMGESFKVLGLNKGLTVKYPSFNFDLSHKL